MFQQSNSLGRLRKIPHTYRLPNRREAGGEMTRGTSPRVHWLSTRGDTRRPPDHRTLISSRCARTGDRVMCGIIACRTHSRIRRLVDGRSIVIMQRPCEQSFSATGPTEECSCPEDTIRNPPHPKLSRRLGTISTRLAKRSCGPMGTDKRSTPAQPSTPQPPSSWTRAQLLAKCLPHIASYVRRSPLTAGQTRVVPKA